MEKCVSQRVLFLHNLLVNSYQGACKLVCRASLARSLPPKNPDLSPINTVYIGHSADNRLRLSSNYRRQGLRCCHPHPGIHRVAGLRRASESVRPYKFRERSQHLKALAARATGEAAPAHDRCQRPTHSARARNGWRASHERDSLMTATAQTL